MHHWTVQYNTLTAAEFIRLWESVWDGAPTREQVQLALAHTLFRVAVYDGEQVIGMARMLGDLGMNYYIKDMWWYCPLISARGWADCFWRN